MPQHNILGLRTTIYRVSDIDRAKAWYARAFEQQPYFDEPFYVGFNIGGYELGLQPREGSPTSPGDSVLTYWGVAEVAASYQHFIELGATAHEPPQNVGGEIIVATVRDPWDNIIGLIYNPHFQLPA